MNKVVQEGVDIMKALDNTAPIQILDKMLQKLDSKALDEIYKITDSKSPGNNDYKLAQATIWAFGKDGELIDQQAKKMAGIMEGLESTFEYLIHQAYQENLLPRVEIVFPWVEIVFPWVEIVFPWVVIVIIGYDNCIK